MAKLPVQPRNDIAPLVETPVEPMQSDEVSSDPTLASRITDRLFGLNGVDRYQLWPERIVRSAVTAPHDVLNSTVPLTSQDLIKPALDMSALAGTGGLAGAGEEAGIALGSTPFLRPALKYQGKIYKAPVGAEHLDAVPKDIYPEFMRQAMSGEDISNFNFGFMNHKGQFLSREDALRYAIDNGLLDKQAGKYGALTSTMEFIPKAKNEITPTDTLAIKSPMTGKIYTGLDTMDLPSK